MFVNLFMQIGNKVSDEIAKVVAANLTTLISEKTTSSNLKSDVDNLPDTPPHQIEKHLDKHPKHNPSSFKIINLVGNPGTGKTNLMAQHCRAVAKDSKVSRVWISDGKIWQYFKNISSNPFNDEWGVISDVKVRLKKHCNENKSRFMIFVDFPDIVDQEMVIRCAKALPDGSQMIVTSREPIQSESCLILPIEGFTRLDASNYLKSHGVRDIFVESIFKKVDCVPSLLHQYVSQKKRNDAKFSEHIDDFLKKGDRIHSIEESMKHNRAAWFLLRLCCENDDKNLNDKRITAIAKNMCKINKSYHFTDEDIEAGLEYLKSCNYIKNSDKIILHCPMIRTEYKKVDWSDSFSKDFSIAIKTNFTTPIPVDYLSQMSSNELKVYDDIFNEGRYGEYITEAKTVLKSVKGRRFDKRVDVEYKIQDAYSKLGEFENALDYALMGPMTHERAIADIKSPANQLNGIVDAKKIELKELENWKEMELNKLIEAISDIGALHTRLNNISACLESLHFYQDSLAYYMRALELLNSANNIDKEKLSRLSATIHSNIGTNYEESGQYNKAMKEYLFGLQERCELRKNGRNDKRLKCQIGYSLFNLGSLLLQQKNFKESQEYFVKALPLILCGSLTKEAQGEVHLKWGKSLRCESKFDEALDHIEKAKGLLRGRLIASCCIEEGMLWYDKNYLSNAEECFEKGLNILNIGQYFGRDSISLKLKLGNCYFWNSKVKEAQSIHQELLKDLYFNSGYIKNISILLSHCHYCLMWDMLFARNISGCLYHARNWIQTSISSFVEQSSIQAVQPLKELEQQYGSLLLP